MKTKKTTKIKKHTSFNSPKNKYRGEIRFSEALEGIGSVNSVTANEIDNLQWHIQYHIKQAHRNNATCFIRIYENLKKHPEFDWVEIESYEA